MECDAVQPRTIHRATQGERFVECESSAVYGPITVPAQLRILLFVPRSNPTDSRDLDKQREGEIGSSLDMDGLRSVVCQDLIDIFERSPHALSNGEKNGNLLGGSKEVVVSAGGQRKVDCR